ncbi:sensor histidine kinase [Salibacterium aidingense]|uniref:sensor histidine kinase n=1 Tax=Salibacterium aidingense TaxID=384933 RepID=UPI0004283BF5|nr:sensor histidine kinase [Salibacterium aidingense]
MNNTEKQTFKFVSRRLINGFERFQIKKIRVKFFFGIILTTIIPIIILAAIILNLTSQKIKDDELIASERINMDLSWRVEQLYQNLLQSSYQIHSNTELLENLRKIKYKEKGIDPDVGIQAKAYLQNMYSYHQFDQVQGMYIVDSTQNIVGRLLPSGRTPVVKMDHSYFLERYINIQNRSARNPYTRVYNQSVYGFSIFQYVAPIKLREENVGMIIFDMDKSILANTVEAYNLFHNGVATVYDSSGNIVYQTRSNNIQGGRDKDYTIETELLDGNLRLNYKYDINPQIIIVRNTAISLIFFSILLTITMSLLMSYNITKPIVNLRKKMGEIEKGNLGTRTQVETKDEVGHLAEGFNSMAEKMEYLIEHDLKMQLKNKETQVKALQAQISPHFLYNSMQMIAAKANEKNTPEIELIATGLSNMYQYNTHIENERVTLRQEIMHVRNYLMIINKRFPNSLKIIMHSISEIENCIIPKFILQPILENSIEHGLFNSNKKKRLLKLSFTKNEHKKVLVIRISDNGKGMSKQRLESVIKDMYFSEKEYVSIGLKNVHQRIQLLCGENYGLTLKSKREKGTCVKLTIPLKE